MKESVPRSRIAKDFMKTARKKASEGDMDRAFELFEAGVNEYLRDKKPMKALAVAKAAKNTFGRNPKAHAMLIRLFISMGLVGDAQQVFSESRAAWKIDAVSAFRELSMDELTGLLEIMEVLHVRKGRYVLRQKQPGEDVYIVISGSLEVLRDCEIMAFMLPGDVFGELGFFSEGGRSASVRAVEACELARFPSGPLRELCGRYSGLKKALESLYSLRILIKAGEDLRDHPLIDLTKDALTTFMVPKGEEIPFDSSSDATIIKHGIIEVTRYNRGLPEKCFLKPGLVIRRIEGIARACTDVEIIRARIDLTGSRN